MDAAGPVPAAFSLKLAPGRQPGLGRHPGGNNSTNYIICLALQLAVGRSKAVAGWPKAD